MTVLNKLLEVLACPACKGPLVQVRWSAEQGAAPAADAPLVALDCPRCRLRYPVVEEIPVMLVDHAQRLNA